MPEDIVACLCICMIRITYKGLYVYKFFKNSVTRKYEK